MPGERNAWVAEEAGAPERRERAVLTGYTLYDLRPEGYPALVAGALTSETPAPGAPPVSGWVLHYGDGVWPAALRHLDELEGLHLTPPLYARQLAEALTAGGPQLVWVYLYARAARLALPGCGAVMSGDWTTTGERLTDTGWPGEE